MKIYSILLAALLSQFGHLFAADQFSVPPAQNRILKIIHGWPDSADAQDGLIQSLDGKGFGGVVCNISFQDYLVSEAKWAAFERAVGAAKAAGMSMWLYDEKGYPSGTAGGLVLKDHPEWEARGLLIAEGRTSGGEMVVELPPGSLVMAAAFPVGGQGLIDLQKRIDLTKEIKERRIEWDAPEGDWWVVGVTDDLIYEGTHAANSLAEKLPCTNLLMAEPTAKFIEVTHARYAGHLGDDLGRWFEATFTDEPSLMSVFLRPMPYKVLPWSPGFAEEFTGRRGYDLIPELPALIAECGAESAKVRHDFWLTVGELVSANYFGQIEDFCREHNIPSGGHLIWEEDIRYHVGFYGDFFRCLREMGSPGIDCLTSIPASVPWWIARLIGSAADLDNKPITMSETSDHIQRYRPAGDTRPRIDVTEDQIRGTCNRLMVGGINRITSYYSFAGLGDDQLNRLNEWVGRCSLMLTGGHQVTDIAVVYPVESMWTRFTPTHHGATDSVAAEQLRQVFDTTSTGLYSARRDFTYIDSRTLVEGHVEDGALVHGSMRWRVIVLPGVDTLPEAAWQNLSRFQRSGGVVVAIGARPLNSQVEFPAAEMVALGTKMLGTENGPEVLRNGQGTGIYLPGSAGGLLMPVLDTILEPYVQVEGEAVLSPVRVTHRRIDDREVFFLINDTGEPVETELSFAAEGAGQQLDPATGEVKNVESGQNVPLKLGPYGGMIFTFGEARERKLLHPAPGALPGMASRVIPAVEPAEGHGEFVRAELEKTEPRKKHGEQTVWKAFGQITKSDVDTFLFTSFEYPAGIDITGAEGLFFESGVPEGQAMRSQLLMILRETDGSDYIASTGRALSSAGWARSYVPISNFQLAGWSADENGRLDLDALGRVSLGWGGYLGKEGETVEFEFVRPTMAIRSGEPGPFAAD